MASDSAKNTENITQDVQQIIAERDYYKEKNETLRKSLKDAIDIVDGLLDSEVELKTTVCDFTGNIRTFKTSKTIRQMAYESCFENLSSKIKLNFDVPLLKYYIKYDKTFKLMNEIVYK